MKKFSLLILLLPIICFAQDNTSQKKIDSLLNVVNSKTDIIEKINNYQLICEEYEKSDIHKIAIYNDKLLQLSKKINYQKGFGFYYLNQFYVLGTDLSKKQIELTTKASSIFKKLNDIKYYLRSEIKLNFTLITNGQSRIAKKKILEILKIAEKSHYNNEIGSLYTLLGALNYFDASLNQSLIYYNKALFYYNKDTNNFENRLDLYLYFSYTYYDLQNYQKSLYYINILNHKSYDIPVNLHKADLNNKLNNYNSALKILLENKNHVMTKNESYNNTTYLAITYFNLKKYNLAIATLLPIVDTKTNREVKILSLNTLSRAYLKLNNLDKAIEFNDKVSALVGLTKFTDFKLDFYLIKSEIEQASGNYKSAILNQKIYYDLKVENYIKINKDQINDLQVGFDVAEKDNNIKNLKLAELQKSIRINKQSNYITFGLLFLVLILFGFLILSKLYNTIKKKNVLINVNNNQLENAKNQLEKSLQVKETLLKEVHHRVKNNLQLVMSLLYIQSKEKGIKMDDFLEISQSRIIAMALIHENLYQTDDLSKVDFKEYAVSLTQSIVTTYNNLEQDIELKINVENIFLDIQTAIPLGLIINELISNAYKHAFVNNKKGIITLQLIQKDTDFELVIKDNGQGVQEKLTTKKSLGLELVHQLVNQINGVLQVHNDLGMKYLIQFQNIKI